MSCNLKHFLCLSFSCITSTFLKNTGLLLCSTPFNLGLPGCFFKFRVCAFGWTWIRANAGRQWKTEGPGILWSMGSRRVRHNVATEHQCAFGRGTVYAILCPVQYIISGDTWFYSVLFLMAEATVKSGQVSRPSLWDSSSCVFTLPQFCG